MIDNFIKTISKIVNFHADGIVIARPYGFEIDFLRNPISGSAPWFFVIILKFIFTPIFENKVLKKDSLKPKKFHFRAEIFDPAYEEIK